MTAIIIGYIILSIICAILVAAIFKRCKPPMRGDWREVAAAPDFGPGRLWLDSVRTMNGINTIEPSGERVLSGGITIAMHNPPDFSSVWDDLAAHIMFKHCMEYERILRNTYKPFRHMWE